MKIPKEVVRCAWEAFHDFSKTQEEAMETVGYVFAEWAFEQAADKWTDNYAVFCHRLKLERPE